MTKVASTNIHKSWSNNILLKCSCAELIPLGTPKSFIAKRTFRSEHDGGGDPLFVHSPDVDGEDGASERTAISESVHYCYCFAARPTLLSSLFAAASSSTGMRGVKRRPRGRSQQESSPMTKWKVQPTDGPNESGCDPKAGTERLETGEGGKEESGTVGWLGLWYD